MCVQGGQRVTVVTASFQDCLLGGDLAGVLALNQRLLEALGHKVVVVRFTDWPVTDNLVARSVAFVKLRQGSGKDRQGMAVKAKGLKA